MVVTYHLYLLIVIKEISSCVASLHLSLSEAPFSGRLEGKGEKVRGMTEQLGSGQGQRQPNTFFQWSGLFLGGMDCRLPFYLCCHFIHPPRRPSLILFHCIYNTLGQKNYFANERKYQIRHGILQILAPKIQDFASISAYRVFFNRAICFVINEPQNFVHLFQESVKCCYLSHLSRILGRSRSCCTRLFYPQTMMCLYFWIFKCT